MTYYNIWAWKDAENPQQPDHHDNSTSRSAAIQEARELTSRFPLVEVEQVEASDYDMNDIQGTFLVRSWKYGKQMTK